MKTKLSNKVQIILVIIFLLSLFIDMFSNYYYRYGICYDIITENFYDTALNDYADYGVVFCYVIIIACLLMIYMCVSENLRVKSDIMPKFFKLSEKLIIKNHFPITYALPVICAICIGIYALLVDGGRVHISNNEYCYEFVDTSIIIPLAILGVMIINCVIDFLDNKKHNQYVDSVQISEIPTPVINDTDEIIKLKELLDMGIITQEEFDAKKKQLLGL